MIHDHLFPSSIEEALELKRRHGERASFLAGGTDLFISLWEGKSRADSLIDLTRIPDLCKSEEMQGDHLIIAACLTADRLSRSPLVRKYIPSLSVAAGQLGSPAVRNQATLGGNIVNASPAADLVPPLMAQGASVQTVRWKDRRSLPIEELTLNVNETALLPGEIVTDVSVPMTKPGEGTAYLKVGLREASTISVATVAVWLRRKKGRKEVESVRIALGSVAPRVLRPLQTEAFLRSQRFTADVIHEAARIASQECEPISDIRASQEYRRAMIGQLVETGLAAAWQASSGSGSARE